MPPLQFLSLRLIQDASSMVFQPLYAQAADIFGRVMQGTEGARLAIMGNLIICDLVPLRDRGAYLALIYCTITVGNGIGLFIGSIIVQSTTWRWVFYMNLPLAGVSLVLLMAFLKVGYYKEPVVQKLKRIDYLGEAIFIGSVAAIRVSLTYAGAKHHWSAWQAILPLVLGFVGVGVFLANEGSRFCLEPTIPPRLFKNRTIVVACILALLNSLLMVWVMYFLPVYFQAVLGSSPAG
jgi:predicted MFS family arabinose efflux permease